MPDLKLAPTLAKSDYAELRQRVKGQRLVALRGSGLPVGDATYQAALAVALRAPLAQEEYDEFFVGEEGVRFFLWLHLKRAGMSVSLETVLAWDISVSMQAEINQVLFPQPADRIIKLFSAGLDVMAISDIAGGMPEIVLGITAILGTTGKCARAGLAKSFQGFSFLFWHVGSLLQLKVDVLSDRMKEDWTTTDFESLGSTFLFCKMLQDTEECVRSQTLFLFLKVKLTL